MSWHALAPAPDFEAPLGSFPTSEAGHELRDVRVEPMHFYDVVLVDESGLAFPPSCSCRRMSPS
jgi:hypothetical protein